MQALPFLNPLFNFALSIGGSCIKLLISPRPISLLSILTNASSSLLSSNMSSKTDSVESRPRLRRIGANWAREGERGLDERRWEECLRSEE